MYLKFSLYRIKKSRTYSLFPNKKTPEKIGSFLIILSPKELDQSVEEVLDTFETEPGFPHP